MKKLSTNVLSQVLSCFVLLIFTYFNYCLEWYFNINEVDFAESFEVPCENEIVFGEIFPYWKVPGTNYPDVTERQCLNALECLEKIDLGENMADSFDNINYKIGDTFEYYCNMKGARGSL